MKNKLFSRGSKHYEHDEDNNNNNNNTNKKGGSIREKVYKIKKERS